MLTLIYPYRNRNIERIKRSLDSLKGQTIRDFTVRFVDYGSVVEIAAEVESLLKNYDFVNYQYYPTQFQPWSKCIALNSVIKELNEGYCFVADVDMIFHSEFIAKAVSLQKQNTATYFKVGFLNEEETELAKNYADHKIDFESEEGATGLTMFPVEALQKLHGFDEFYHFWGAEDTDMHVRLRNSGCAVNFYDDDILMLHQWHSSYRSKESSKISEELQLSGIVQLNHFHLNRAEANETTVVNRNGWGLPLNHTRFEFLQNFNGKARQVTNKKEAIDHFLFCELSDLDNEIYRFVFSEDDFQNSLKYKAKRSLGKKVPTYYSMKEINDLLLLHIISFYRNYHYNYQVSEADNSIQLTIYKP
jgi:glycosyltransferase involved in cell wall biosynthesis